MTGNVTVWIAPSMGAEYKVSKVEKSAQKGDMGRCILFAYASLHILNLVLSLCCYWITNIFRIQYFKKHH